jgi:hypothetical protein
MFTWENYYENQTDRLGGTAMSSNGALVKKPVVRYDKKEG